MFQRRARPAEQLSIEYSLDLHNATAIMARWPTATDSGLKVRPLWREMQCGRNLVVGFVLLRRERERGRETSIGRPRARGKREKPWPPVVPGGYPGGSKAGMGRRGLSARVRFFV